MDDLYSGRSDALEQTWRVWAELGDGLTEDQWSTATRCPGWDVAAAHTRKELVDWFSGHGPRALQRLRQAEATLVVPWPASGVVITLGEALRIVILEATVHLIDVQRALGHPPAVPPPALKDTAQLLAELAPAVELIEAATGRSTHSPLPVLR